MPLQSSRRTFLTSVAAAAVGPVVLGRGVFAQSLPARADAVVLRQRIEALSVFGRASGGTFADGVSRVAYSDADIAGRQYTIGLMRAAGLEPRVDAAGNMFGRRAGTDASLPPILFGSHIDSVPNGGNFDGDLGALAAVSAIEALAAANVRTRHPLEMVVWSAEESATFIGLNGSRLVAGDVKPSDMDRVWNGMTRADAIRKIGGAPERITDAIRPRGAHHCYLELHIEQGGVLDRARIPIGVVEGIVSIHRYEVTVTGFANHAGTTPMADRQDALLAAHSRAFERSGRLDEKLGVRHVRWFLPDGDAAKRWRRRRDPPFRIIRKRRDAQAFRQRTALSEKSHLVMLVLGAMSTGFAWVIGWPGWTLYLTAGNVVVNLYPVLLQRYTRARLRVVFRRHQRMST